ncbi:NAD-dependent succinate-semialdehyde dehydrogenase [Rhodococcus sp. NPDC057529]|uniref:NAD-dependent succinate-semialdehyde dehydrogenase n=1 Tax=Rhodococcus sp. NPDC057529 TaxID=3346158 RepID=UPI00366DB399
MTPIIRTFNPATAAELAQYETFTASQVDGAIADTHAATAIWSARPIAERCTTMAQLAQVLRSGREEFARLITSEMGKPLAEALAEVDKCALNCDYYIESGPAFLEPEHVPTSAESSFVTYEPLGVIYAVMPWNFPFWQLFRFAVPAMLAGNGVLLKHSPNVTGCAVAIEKIIVDAGFPSGLLRTLIIDDSDISEVTDTVMTDPRVAAATLTGSTRAGGSVAAAAGRALKKSVLELGGSDPFIVLADADLESAAKAAAASRFLCTGQVCIAAKRIIVHAKVADRFQELFVKAVENLNVGDPLAEGTTTGPMARPDLLDAIDRQVRDSVRSGAKVLVGGHRREGEGWFYEPTVLTEIDRTMPVFAEETFGPVAVLISAQTDDEAIAIANDTEYGLAASVWSQDRDRALALGRKIVTGCLFVNASVDSDPRIPFGGIKRSGYGRELGRSGIREFTNLQTVWIAPTPTGAQQ